MTKNKMFKRRYTIEIKGITTNDHMTKFIDEVIASTFLALRMQFKSLKLERLDVKDITREKGESKK